MATPTDAPSMNAPTPEAPGVDGLNSTIMADARGNNLTTAPSAVGLATTAPVGAKSATALLQRGDYVGRYLILSRTGQGGMGIVYSAHDPELDRKIAIKLLLSEKGSGTEGSARLLREAQALAKLSHPNVVSVHDVGTLGDRVWIAMEFVEGHTVGKWFKEKRRNWREVLDVFLQAGEGLKAAHSAGFVHRDFKPDNVMLTESGRVKVMDFGLARIEKAATGETFAELDSSATVQDVALARTGVLLGTPRYMAPEQWDGANTDARTDQFSFSISLWEALYGEPPFAGGTLAELAVSVKQGRVRPTPKGSRVPRWLQRVVSRGLQVDPAARWPSMDAMLDALRMDPTGRNWALGVGALAAAALCAVGILWSQDRSLRVQEISSTLNAAEGIIDSAKTRLSEAKSRLDESFSLFDAGQTGQGEGLWDKYVSEIPKIEEELAQATQTLENALILDTSRDDVRNRLLDGLLLRALTAEQMNRGTLAVKELVERIKAYDIDRTYIARWDAPASLSVRTEPVGARVVLERYETVDGRRRISEKRELGESPVAPQSLPRGSYRLSFELVGYTQVVYPLVLGRGEALEVDVPLLRSTEVPTGFVYVPPGRFTYGSDDPDEVRQLLSAEPQRVISTGPYLIARHEVTYADFLVFLEALSPEERRKVLGGPTGDGWSGVKLAEVAEGGWKLDLNQGIRAYSARLGEPLVYEGRRQRGSVDWTQLPISGFSSGEARAYLQWLDRSGRVPGARFCNEHEWERASRGADDRRFAHGELLDANEANIVATYERLPTAIGPDPVGLYPQSQSPFGLEDTVGNVFEMAVSPFNPDAVVARGGSYFFEGWVARASNRQSVDAAFRDTSFGLRVCASVPKRAP